MTHAAGNRMEAHGQYPLTLVTAYFELGGKPGCPENPYPAWIRNFLPLIRWPLVIFCDEQSLDMLREARGDKPAVWHVTSPREFYSCRYLDGEEHIKFDAGDFLVTRSLVWHEKHHFLRQALSENPFGSEMLFWCDIGQFRHDPDAPTWSTWRITFRLFEEFEWPNLEVCRALPEDKAVLVRGFLEGDYMWASLFGGAAGPSRRWCDAYYHYLDQREQKGVRIQRDEEVMMSCWMERRELAHVILPGCVPYIKGRRRLGCRWYLLNGRRFPWKYVWRRFFPASAQ